MIVYGTGYSPYVRKVLVSLAEKGIAYEHRPVMFHAPDADFQAASPLGKIPAIEDDGFRLADSSAILWYLERKHPTPALVPTEPKALGRAVWFDKFGDTELFAKLIVPFVQRVLKPNMMKQPTDEVRSPRRSTRTCRRCSTIWSARSRARIWSVTRSASPTSPSRPASTNLHLAQAKVDADRWPKLAAYVDATLARPSFKAALEAKKG